MHIAFLGTRGIPAKYGGFETAVENIALHLVQSQVAVTVYGSRNSDALTTFQNINIISMPALKSRSLETLSRTAFSTLHVIFRLRPDVVVLMNSANAPLISVLKLFRIPVIAHLDGQEWLRPKWKGARARYSHWANGWAARKANAVIADNPAIKQSLDNEYGISSVYIPYGWQITRPQSSTPKNIFEQSLVPSVWKNYFLVVARWEQENHVLEAVKAFHESQHDFDLLVIGSQGYRDEYSDDIEKVASTNTKIHLLGSIWDKELLTAIYSGAAAYIHGHSVGGTNPSLLHALGAHVPVLAYNCTFNQSVADQAAQYWVNQSELTDLIKSFTSSREVQLPENFDTTFDWSRCAQSILTLAQHVS